ncbi:ABC transporter ATP-binding protein [Aerococcus urinae]|uniref:ABC transporter ATP-binding protein n=1 Tax=Aerococcus mictus TaxID=2976810 RepID=A0A9Q4H598_9LACT|nr:MULTISPECIES: ABC transporter ATP-binding protein [Aerococcus]MCY3034813.1 ABC transporter ATP-binding protein/permease [Aerococcus mictus]MCY3064147.1 ABC transporter ATP-binding protein/permease [Aerococcus mictus]MCY3064830.1 ABC transporter ATP-binding protein/permease [Aerococcus mictus]MCY3068056.1 ABC transporter ATP-binding protein/permease [Aerococcus mictus]MCY3069377.1 ABC transporter ATP-binding protein/permease [Aerococcus mictus]
MRVKDVILENKGKEILAFSAKLIEAVLELMVPYVMADLINKGINPGNTTYIWQRGLLLVLLPFLGYCFALVCQWYASVTMQTVGTRLRSALFDQVNQLTLSQLNQVGADSLVTRVTNDTNNIQEAVARALRLASRSPVIVIGAIIMAYLISPQLSPIFIIAGLILGLAFTGITLNSNRRYQGIQHGLDRLSQVVRENLNGIRVIRAFVNQKKEIQRFQKENDHLVDQQIRVGQVQALATPISLSVVNIAIGLILYFGGRLVNNAYLMQGEIIALTSYMTSIFLALSVLVRLLVVLSRGFASARRIDDFLALPVASEEQSDLEPNSKNDLVQSTGPLEITFDQVNFSYSDRPLLSDLSFQIHAGEFIGIIGGTAAGKTSLVNLILAFNQKQSGDIKINGQAIEGLSLKGLRQAVALVPQKAVLFKGSLRDNLKMDQSTISDADLWQALEDAQAADFIKQAQGLDTPVDQGGMNFSGGQRQRLTIARALAQSSRAIILDDAVSALDFATEGRLRQVLLEKEQTLIMVSQRISSILHADKILVLDHGGISRLC